jgi:hypothetical protein
VIHSDRRFVEHSSSFGNDPNDRPTVRLHRLDFVGKAAIGDHSITSRCLLHGRIQPEVRPDKVASPLRPQRLHREPGSLPGQILGWDLLEITVDHATDCDLIDTLIYEQRSQHRFQGSGELNILKTKGFQTFCRRVLPGAFLANQANQRR